MTPLTPPRGGAGVNQRATHDADFVWPPPDDVLQKLVAMNPVAESSALPAELPPAGEPAAAKGEGSEVLFRLQKLVAVDPVAGPTPQPAEFPSDGEPAAAKEESGELLFRTAYRKSSPGASVVTVPSPTATAGPEQSLERLNTRSNDYANWQNEFAGRSTWAWLPRLKLVHWALAIALVLIVAEGVFIAVQMNRQPELQLMPVPVATPATAANPLPTPTAAPDIENPSSSAAATTTGPSIDVRPVRTQSVAGTTGTASRLIVRSDPPGARVTLNGRERGTTPLTLTGVAPGVHKVVVHGPFSQAEHTVNVERGATASVVASLAATSAAGWISLRAPAGVQILENGELLGTTATERIMVEAKRHTIDLVSEELGYRSQHVVDVSAGAVSRIEPQLPMGILHANALPWAEVWFEGRKIGDTPLGNVSLPIGRQEITFRHPDFPEVKRTVLITLHGPARMTVNMENQGK